MIILPLHVFNLVTDKPADQPMEEEQIVEDSQDIVFPFSLHLTQSQPDMKSQAPLEPGQPMEVIREVMFKRKTCVVYIKPIYITQSYMGPYMD